LPRELKCEKSSVSIHKTYATGCRREENQKKNRLGLSSDKVAGR
jgi:hypothetical protein